MAICVQAPSRLHFGLIALGGDALRMFGGAGLMIRDPGLELVASFDQTLDVMGTVPEAVLFRAREILTHIADRMDDPNTARIVVEIKRTPTEHQGLGTGTQLSLAIATAVCHLVGIDPSSADLAAMTGRGARSAIGIHGFRHGGFLVDGGKGPTTKLAPLVARADFPEDWPILLIQPTLPSGISGMSEQALFATRPTVPPGVTERLSALVLLGMLPALLERDYRSFGDALFEFNYTVGGCFAYAQGGHYAHPQLARIIDFLRRLDLRPLGQSSWGPSLFCVASDIDQATWIRQRLVDHFSLGEGEVTVTLANNDGAIVSKEPVHA